MHYLTVLIMTADSLEEIMQRYYVLPEGEIVIRNQYFTMEKIHCLRKRVVKSGNWKIAVVIDGPGKGKEYYLTEDTEFLAGQTILLCSQGI